MYIFNLKRQIMYLFLQLSLSFLVSYEALIILQQATRKTHPRAYQCIWDNYVRLVQKILQFHYFVSMGCLYIHVFKMGLCLKIRSSISFDTTWYAEASMYIKSLLFSQSTVLLFLVNKTGEGKIDKEWPRWMWWKIPLCKWHTFWMSP